MKIWWQSSTPIHRLHDYRTTLTAHLDSVKRPDTEIHINGVDNGSMDLHYNAIVAMNSFAPGGVLNKMIQAGEKGYDAIAIGCFLDPAMQEAREVVPIPVFGRRIPRQTVAVLRSQGFRVRVELPPYPIWRSRNRFQRGTKRIQQPGPNAGAFHQRSASASRAGCGGDPRRVRDGQRDHPPGEPQGSRRRAYPRLQRRSAQNN